MAASLLKTLKKLGATLRKIIQHIMAASPCNICCDGKAISTASALEILVGFEAMDYSQHCKGFISIERNHLFLKEFLALKANAKQAQAWVLQYGSGKYM